MKRLSLPPFNLLAIVHDAAMAAFSFWLAHYLRLGERLSSPDHAYIREGSLAFVALLLLVMLYFRAYRHVWRFTSLTDLLVIGKAGTIALIAFYAMLFSVMRLENVPRSVPFIHWMTVMLCLMSGRVLWRLAHDRALVQRLIGRAQPQVDVLMIGATPQAETFIREATRNIDFPYRVVGLIDDDRGHHGREIQHVRVYGGIPDVPATLRKLARKGFAPKRLVVADPALPRAAFESLLQIAEQEHLSLTRLPILSELKAGERTLEIKPVAVEDILGRQEAVLNPQVVTTVIAGKRILITGAGGSIGGELARQIAGLNPESLTLLEQSEYNLYTIDRQVAAIAPELKREAILADVRDGAQLTRIFARLRPDIVFHAAAIKHVPLAEANPDQAILTNLIGSRQVADACAAHDVQAMVMISTDKAVNPTSVMGATKRAAEIYCHASAAHAPDTRAIIVRFGNVLNSNGSVVPLFQEQIARGGPVTVTHPDMTRYFMSIREAVQLVLQAASLGLAEQDRSPIYVLDMGVPVKIEELACQMIRLAGLRPRTDIAIEYIGLRPGEKLFEELFYNTEQMRATSHGLIFKAQPEQVERAAVLRSCEALAQAASQGEQSQAVRLLRELVPEYLAAKEQGV